MIITTSKCNLHSTMYLLNLDMQDDSVTTNKFTFHYVSIKSKESADSIEAYAQFTFHYVSIKSNRPRILLQCLCYLHSTMYLLNLALVPVSL